MIAMSPIRYLSLLILSLLMALSVTGVVTAFAEDPTENDYYTITTFETPADEVIEACGFQRMPDGKLAVCSRRGDIFMITEPLAKKVTAEQFHLYARGLHEPLSLALRDGWLYAVQRPEVTRMRDTDGDGRADVFDTYADGWGISGNYHEYAFGSKFDADGNMYITLCLTGSFSSDVPFRGWAMKITPDGETRPMSSGVRSPGGMGSDTHGNILYTDNQGPWNGTCGLKMLRQGKFLGHPGGFRWYDLAPSMGPRPSQPDDPSRMVIEAAKIPELVPPVLLFPYDKMGKSASGIACDTTEGKFGPFAGQLFVGDQTQSCIMRVFTEQIDGVWQGVCFPFRKGFASGNVGVEMDASGALFVGGTNRGWGSVGPREFAIERLDWNGRVPFEIKEMRLTKEGFELVFTEPVDAATAGNLESYQMSTYTYMYREPYGSPEVDTTLPKIISATVSDDLTRVHLIVPGLQLGHVHELHADGVLNKDGNSLLHKEAYYTINKLR